MKKLLLYFTLLFIVSCSSNNYHDGKYQDSVFTNASLTWVNKEQIELKGNEMYITTLSIIDNSIIAEFKTTCTQYPEKIEFKGKDGITYIARVDEDGNIKYGEYTYKKIRSDDYIVEQRIPKALIENSDNNKTAKLPDEKEKPQAQHENNLISEIKTYSDKDVRYNYVEDVKPDKNEKFFQGSKTFDGHIDDVYGVMIKGNKVKIYSPQDGDEIILNGQINNGSILDESGQESRFIYINPLLFYKNRNNEWFVFKEFK